MSSSSKKNVILCVDDEAIGLSVRKLILEAQGYQVFTAENGPEALRLFSSNAIDVVILDYAMPGMHGGTVAERMRAINPAVPILMLSAYIDLPRETLELVDKYVTKGEPPPVLLKAVAELLTSHHGSQSKSTYAV